MPPADTTTLLGVEVSLTLIKLDSKGKPVNKSENFAHHHRSQVVSIGKKLKSHGSLRTMIQDILNTPTFKAPQSAEVGGN